jgi:hypothetical protein
MLRDLLGNWLARGGHISPEISWRETSLDCILSVAVVLPPRCGVELQHGSDAPTRSRAAACNLL